MGPTSELRGTRYYVAWGVARRGRLFLLGSPEEAFRRHDAQARLSPPFDRPC